jgi:hypothetical protein
MGDSRYANGCEESHYARRQSFRLVSHLADVTDRMHGLLIERADALMGCTEKLAASPM